LGTENTALGDCNVAQTNVEGRTTLPAVTIETGIGMPGQNEFQLITSPILKLHCISADRHTISGLYGARELGFGNSIDLNNAQATCPVWLYLCQWFQPWIVTESGYVYTGFRSCLKYSLSFLSFDLPVIDPQEDTFFFLN
jgi:hypothetical protein